MSNNIIHVNQELIQTELKELVRNSVEETLNAMLDAEADRLVNAERYARDEQRKGYRSGHYDRSFTTTSGDVTLRMPKLRGLTFETSIIERYKRRETVLSIVFRKFIFQAKSPYFKLTCMSKFSQGCEASTCP